jgi:hypothetical protein
VTIQYAFHTNLEQILYYNIIYEKYSIHYQQPPNDIIIPYIFNKNKQVQT